MKVRLRKLIAGALSVTLVTSGITVSGLFTEKTEAAPNYQLVWSDEFNGNALDRSVWNIEVNGDGGGNGELQYYTDSANNISVNNGTLKITARKENYNGKNYTSGRITTQGKKHFQYGKFEARIKVPSFTGSWPAFWTLGESIKNIGWPNCGEIDIMEAVNTENKVYGTGHWSYNGNHAESGNGTNISNRTDWHVYGLEWDENELRWYLDGVQYNTLSISEASQMDEFKDSHFILLNLAIGGKWPGNTIDDSAFSQGRTTMEVDYVRVYQDANSQAMTFTPAIRDGNFHPYGNWEVYVASAYGNSTAQVAVDPTNRDHIKLQQLTSSWDDAWLVQARYTKSGLTTGKKYKISVDLKSASTDGQYATDARDDGATVSLIAGTKTVTKIAEADESGKISIKFGIGWVGTAVPLDFSNVKVRDYDPNEVVEPTDTLEYISVIRDGKYHAYGNWELFVENTVGTSQAKVAVDETNKNHIQVQHSQVDWGGITDSMFVRARYTAKNLTPGRTYTLSVRMLTGSTDGGYTCDAVPGQEKEVVKFIKGERYVNKTAVADGNGQISLQFGFGWVGTGVAIDLDKVTVKEGNAQVNPTTWNYQNVTRNDLFNPYGNWTVYVGTWSGSTAKIGINPQNADNINIVPLSIDWGAASQWSIQARYTKKGLVPGKMYKLSMEMISMGGEGSYMADDVAEADRVALPLQVGKKTVTKIAAADNNGELYITFGLGMIAVDTPIEFNNIKCVEYNENQVIIPEPTTERPIETTTQKEVETTSQNQNQPPVNGTNVALRKNATASGTEGAGVEAANAVDGNIGTRWSSNFADNAWITVDLGSVYAINGVLLKWEAAYGESYNIQVSTNGTNYTTVKSISGENGGDDSISFNTVNARYVRMQGVKRALPYGYSLWEMEVYAAGGGQQETTKPEETTQPEITTQPDVSNNTNLALKKNATASGTENDAMSAANAFDGNTGTRWSSNFADNAWVTVDLGKTYSINRVELNWEGAYGESYNIQVSTNGTNFTTVKSMTGQNGGKDTVTFNAVNARYVRMQGVKRALPYGYSLWEMEVYGGQSQGEQETTNNTPSAVVSKGKTATASGVENNAMSAANAFDGNTGTRWSSNFADNAWITVDLGRVYSVDKVELNWEGAYGESYNIQVSTDGNNFTTVKALTGQNGGKDTITFNAVNARYVRMQGVKRALPYGYSLWEMEVYGK